MVDMPVPATADPLKVYVQVGSLIGAVGALIGIIVVLATKTYPWLKAKLDRRSLQKRMGAEIFPAASIERSIRYYITPYCQNVDPATGDEPGAIYSVKQDLFKALDDALNHPTEYKYLILLADSGMGKTSALINYYVRHLRRWRRKFEINLVPLNIPDADERIALIQDKANTVLFLDALDEDTLAIVDHVERIRLLLKLTRDFERVVITCRTQFFPKDEEIPKETGILKIGGRPAGEKAEYIFHKLYISPFTDAQVNKYLNRRYPLWNYLRRRQAKLMVRKIPNLTVRPMLLAHIDDLVETNRKINSSYELYEEMIEAWLRREEGFIKEKEDLREFCKLLAVDLYTKRQGRGAERVPRAELTSLAKDWNIPLDDWKLGGRSLLNRDAQGNYKFAHRSIMEYLFVKSFVQGHVEHSPVELTDQMKVFLSEIFIDQAATGKEDFFSALLSEHRSASHIAILIDALINSKALTVFSRGVIKELLVALLSLIETMLAAEREGISRVPVLAKIVEWNRSRIEFEYFVIPNVQRHDLEDKTFVVQTINDDIINLRVINEWGIFIESVGRPVGIVVFPPANTNLFPTSLEMRELAEIRVRVEPLLPLVARLMEAWESARPIRP